MGKRIVMENKIITPEFEFINLGLEEMGKIYSEEIVDSKGDKKFLHYVDFGKKTRQDVCELPLKFISDEYTITDTNGSCGCTTGLVNKNPDGSQSVVVRFKASTHLQKGLNEKVLTLYCNHGYDKYIKINVVVYGDY